MKIFFTSFWCILIFSTFSLGQVSNAISQAEKMMGNEAYELAVESFEQLLSQEGEPLNISEKLDVLEKLAQCYGKLKLHDKQAEQLIELVKLADPKTNTSLIRESYRVLTDEIFMSKDIMKALEIAQEAEIFEEKTGNSYAYTQGLHTTGGIYYFLQQFDKASEKYLKAYKASDDIELKFESLIYLASCNREENMAYSDSLYREAIDLAEIRGDSLGFSTAHGIYGDFLLNKGKHRLAIEKILIAIDYKPKAEMYDLGRMESHTSLAQIFYSLKNIERATYYIERAVELGEKRNYKFRNGTTASVYGQILVANGNTEQAYKEFLKGEDYFGKRNFSLAHLNTVCEIGILDLKRGDYDKAKLRYEQAIVIQDQKEVDNSEPFGKFQAKIFLADKKYSDAIRVAQQTYINCKKSETSSCVVAMLEILTDAYKAKGDSKMALKSLEERNSLKDSIFQSTQNQIVFDLESKYKRKEQDQSLALLNVENKLSEEKLSRQNSIILVGGIALSLISFLSFFLFSLYKRINNQKEVIQKALSEKDVLLREIHHRVKNNLQLVSSLLTLQSRSITDETAIAAINSGKARVRSMALIHQDLYGGENLTGISVKGYVEKLCLEIFATYNINPDVIDLSLEVDDLDLDVETVVPMGLIINELITNCLKYAFPNNAKGNINVKLKEKEGKLILQLKDNGIGLDTEAFRASTSFGNRLVKILSQQLDGILTVASDKGTTFKIEINDYSKAA